MDNKQKAQKRNFNKKCLACAVYGLKSMVENRKEALTFNEKVKLHEMINTGMSLLRDWSPRLKDIDNE